MVYEPNDQRDIVDLMAGLGMSHDINAVSRNLFFFLQAKYCLINNILPANKKGIFFEGLISRYYIHISDLYFFLAFRTESIRKYSK